MRSEFDYDAERRTLVYHSDTSGPNRMEMGVARELASIVRSGTCPDGAVVAGEVRFEDDDAAQFNAAPLSFLQLASVGPSGPVADETKFSVREDFGISSK